MSIAKKCMAIAASLAFAAVPLVRPLDVTASGSLPPVAISVPPDTPQATFADLWRVDGTFQSTIRMKNLMTFRSVLATPVLYMSDGTEYDLKPVTLASSAMADIDVNQALENAPPNIAPHLSQFGSAAVKYMGVGSGMVAGEIMMLDAPVSLVFSTSFQMPMMPGMAMSSTARTQTLEGLWWKHDSGVGGYVNVSNTTNHPVNVSVQATNRHGTGLPPETISLNPYAERILDLDSLTLGLEDRENQAGGLRVQYVGQMGDIEVSGGLEGVKEGYSTNIPFWQHDPTASTKATDQGSEDRSEADESGNSTSGQSAPDITLAAVGVMLGAPDSAQGFPDKTRFMPYLALRNTTGQPMALTSTLFLTSGGKTLSLKLPDETLGAYEARQVDMSKRLKSLGLRDFNGTVNLAVTYTGAVADLVMAAGAVDQTGSYVFAVYPQIVEEGKAKDSSWMVGDGYDSMFTIWNPSNEPEDLVATFSYPDGSSGYKLPIHLNAHASANIDIWRA